MVLLRPLALLDARLADESDPAYKRFYPTNTLVTGFDIIFFWVARMMMMGLYATGRPPFSDVYIHALVRDEAGQKMSKSKGNVIDPLDLIEEYGADALRFTLCAMESQGRDIKMSASRVEGYRNFSTKLWNAVRFAQMNGCARDAGFDPGNVALPVNRWLVAEARAAIEAADAAIAAYPLQRPRRRRLPLHLEHVLRLVCRAHQAGAQWRRTGRRRRSARRPVPGRAT